jgi:AAA+ ATPase superfamily predicted ATPase
LNDLTPSNLADHIRDVVRERRWQNNTILLLIDGNGDRLQPHLPTAMPVFVRINQDQQKAIQNADSPTAVTLDILLKQMPRSQLAPYETNKPVVGSQFFGRRQEKNKVLSHPQRNYLFLGVRRIGKTSLLKELQQEMNRLDPPEQDRIRRLYVNCIVISSEEEFWRALIYELDKSEIRLLSRGLAESSRSQRLLFDRFAAIHGGPITFFIDELDRLLEKLSDKKQLFDVLRAASIAGKARFIMAGYRRAMIASANQQSPFFNMAEVSNLRHLNRAEVRYMIVAPMERLRISIQNREEIVNRINRETAGLPNYVQFYCKTLLDQLDREGRDTITEDDLQLVYENLEFRNFVLNTFIYNTEPLERALVYSLIVEGGDRIRQDTFSEPNIDEVLKKHNLQVKYQQLDQACQNLAIAGVFNQVGRDYEFAVPLFQRILRLTKDVGFLLEKTLEEIQASKIYQ